MPRTPYDYEVAGTCHFEGSGVITDSLVPSLRFTENFSGVSRRKPSGFIPPTAYSFFYRSVANANGIHKSFVSNTLDKLYSGTIGGGGGQSGRFLSSDHFNAAMLETDVDLSLANPALIKARNKLKATDVNLGVAFAERSATARLVGDTATNLARSYRSLRRGEIRKAMDALGISSSRREPRGANAPQKWLELQYGWKPLLSDVHGACDALSKRPKSDWLVTAKASKSSETPRVVKRVGIDAGTMVASRKDSVFVRIDALPQNEALISLVSVGITNPLLIGWELVPFSFVVDWFLPVGGYLESIDALLGFSTYGFSSSLLTKISWDGKGENYDPPGPIRYENSYSESKRTVRLVRTVSQNVPFPQFPRFKDPRSIEHMANGLSLLATVFGRK